MSNEKQEINSILEYIGGKENIRSLTHCMTRLRFILVDESKVQEEKLNDLEIVKGLSRGSGQYQVIIGPGKVERVYKELNEIAGFKEPSFEDQSSNQSTVQKFINIFSGIFIPIIPALTAAGILLGLCNVFASPGVFGPEAIIEMVPSIKGIYEFVHLIANTAFQFLPVLIGWSAVRKFGGNPVLGIVLGLILVHPELMSSWDYVANPSDVNTWNLLGLDVNMVGYQGQIVTILCSSYILAKLELFFKKVIHDNVQNILVPPLTLIITTAVTFIVLGPVTMYLSNLITNGFVALYDVVPVFAAALLSFVFPLLLITGMHHIFLAVNLQMLGVLGYVYLWPRYDTVTQAMAAAAITIFFITKDKKEKGIALSGGISAFLGITEPAIYGVNLPRKYPFISVMISSAIGSAYLSAKGIKAVSLGNGGLMSILSVYPNQWGDYIIGNIITIVITVGLVVFFSRANVFSSSKDEPNIFEKMREKRVKGKLLDK